MTYEAILRRTGNVLIVIGLLDTGLAIYAVANDYPYGSSLTIFAVIAGVFLRSASLRAARFVRWFGLFLVAAIGALTVLFPLVQPWGLTVAQVRQAGLAGVGSTALVFGIMALLIWVIRQLGRPEVQDAIVRVAGKRSSTAFPLGTGIVIVAMMCVTMLLVTRGETSARATSMVAEKMGQGYDYHVRHLQVVYTGEGKTVDASVSAWNETELHIVPVRWVE